MVVDEFSSNDELLQGADIAENFQLHNESEYIVEVNGDDLDDEGLSVVDVVDAGEEKRKKIRKNVGRLVDEIDANIDKTYTNDADSMPPIGQDECAEFIRTAAKAADQRKAGDIVALRISKLSYISSFLLVATGKNTPQLRAISNLIEDDLAKKHELHPRRIDGVASSGWILLDCEFLLAFFLSSMCTEFICSLTNTPARHVRFPNYQMAIS